MTSGQAPSHASADTDQDEPRTPEGGPAVVPGADTISRPPQQLDTEGAGADMGPAGGPEGAACEDGKDQ